MEWLRAHHERVVLGAAALLLLFCAVSIWRSAVGFGADFAEKQGVIAPKKASPPREAVDLARAQEKLQQPAQWAFRERTGLFVPEKHFIGPEGLPVTLKTSEVHPPVPNEWLETYGLPIADSDVLSQHQDTNEQMILVKEKVAISPESVVTFEYSWPATAPARDFIVRRDQEFSLKPSEDIKYKLVDVQPTKAVIANTRDPDKPIEIGL